MVYMGPIQATRCCLHTLTTHEVSNIAKMEYYENKGFQYLNVHEYVINYFFCFKVTPVSQGGAPIWRIEPPRTEVFSNSTGARVECVAAGMPPPSIEWYQDDQLITHNIHGLRIVMTNGTLVFPPFK